MRRLKIRATPQNFSSWSLDQLGIQSGWAAEHFKMKTGSI